MKDTQHRPLKPLFHYPFLQQDIRLALWTVGRDASIDLDHLDKTSMKTLLVELRAEIAAQDRA